MTTLAAASRLPAPDFASDIDASVLEGALRRGCRQLRFGGELEQAYERATGAARARRHIACNLLGGATFWLLSGNGPSRLSHVHAHLHWLRVAAIALAGLVVVLLWFSRRSTRALPRDALTALSALGIASYSCATLPFVNGTAALMHSSGVMLILLHVGIGARLQFRYTVAVNLLVYFTYAAFARGNDPQSAVVLDNQLLLFAVVLVFSTVGNYLLERRERDAFLLDRLKRRQHDALLADTAALRELTLRDGLTRLYNRRHFDAELGRAWAGAQRTLRPVGLLQVDVDHFKRYNDCYGHPAGDRCLFEVGAALESVAQRHGGLAARVGGEEFALLFSAMDEARIAGVAAETCEAVRALALVHETSNTARIVTVSVGAVALTPRAGLWASSLVGAADAALYAAKSEGRDRHAGCAAPLVGTASPRLRKGVDSLLPEPDAPADDLARVERLTGLLDGGRRRLRFPDDIESEFQQRAGPARRRDLAFISVGGMALLLLYTAISGPVIPDVVDRLMQHLLALTLVCIGLTSLNLKLGFDWRIREGIFTAMVCSFGLLDVWIESQSAAPTVYSATLALCLLPMFSCLVAAQPLRFCLLPSVLICVAIAGWMTPTGAANRDSWTAMLSVHVSATLYSLLGGYLLEVSKRRGYLLDQLRIAQLSILQRNTAHLRRLATLDPLTRLPNRRHFEAELERLATACAATREPLGLLIVDVDHFKQYNDGYGHPAGDACLQRLGAALQQWAQSSAALSQGDRAPVTARIGGEEFGVLLPGSDASLALATAQRLRQMLHDLRIEHAHSPVGRYITASIGAASLVLESAADARLLLTSADAALYRAKGLGRDQAAA